MSRGKVSAEVWPSRLALEQRRRELARAAPGGLLFAPPLYTFDGRAGLLQRLAAQMPAAGPRPLAELAGPLIVHGLLRALADQEPQFGGLAAGRRLPHRLWRLLVQIKAAGLGAQDLSELAGQRGGDGRLAGLGRLLAKYQERLAAQNLVDEADRLAALESALAEGWQPPALAEVAELRVMRALWLRPLDLRLLRALSRRLRVRVEFALVEPRAGRPGVWGLLRATAAALEAGQAGEMEITWGGEQAGDGPLAGAAGALLALDAPAPDQPLPLELLQAGGRYAEAEALVAKALDLARHGAPLHEIILAFPDLGLYGPMAADAARRLGLPLTFRRGQPLAGAPLTRAFLSLAGLPLAGYPRAELADVLESPQLAEPLAAWLLGPGGRLPAHPGRLLTEAGYVDGRETPPSAWLNRRAALDKKGYYAELSIFCDKLINNLAGLGLDRPQPLTAYVAALRRLWQALSAGGGWRAPGPWPVGARPEGLPGLAALKVAEGMAQNTLDAALAGLEEAARQSGDGQDLTPGRCLALVREALAGVELPGGGQPGGVAVLRLEDAQGLRPAHLLVGGLNLGEFPQKPGQALLGGEERLALGRRAGLPVWRTEEEEYGGQVLRLALLLADVRQSATLSCALADAGGRELNPAFVFTELAERHGPARQAGGGAFGQLAPLLEAREPLALWGGLARALLAPGPVRAASPEAGLARAALWHCCQGRPEAAARWQDLAGRAAQEARREALDALAPERRPEAADAFSGRLGAPEAAALLDAIMAQPERRLISPSFLDDYNACPQAWFWGRLLRLAKLEPAGWDLERSGEGEWVHRALALYFGQAAPAPPRDPADPGPRLAACLDLACRQLREEGRAGHPAVWRARQAALAGVLAAVLRREEQDLAGWRIEGLEWELPEQGGLTLAMDQGPPLRFKGRLDRLERNDAAGLLRVTDYKHAKDGAKLKQGAYPPEKDDDASEIASYQIPVYLAGAAEVLGLPPGGVQGRLVNTRLASLKPCSTRPVTPGDPFLQKDPAARQALAGNGQVNLFNAVAALWSRLCGGDFVARPAKNVCKSCDQGLVCRARPAAAGGEEEAEGGDA
ncbi:MAG: PD-(D/E)XK nuclease family protein [Thermodesulfobacteriota bacterium]